MCFVLLSVFIVAVAHNLGPSFLNSLLPTLVDSLVIGFSNWRGYSCAAKSDTLLTVFLSFYNSRGLHFAFAFYVKYFLMVK